MVRHNKLQELENRKARLVAKLERAFELKRSMQLYSAVLEKSFATGEISSKQYELHQQNVLKSKSLEEWNAHYDSCIKQYKAEHRNCVKAINAQKAKHKIVAPVLVAMLLISALFLGMFAANEVYDSGINIEHTFSGFSVDDSVVSDATSDTESSPSESAPAVTIDSRTFLGLNLRIKSVKPSFVIPILPKRIEL